MGKVIANVLLGALTIALTIFTASRTLDLLSQWLPVNQTIYVWLGLAAFEGGFVLWCLFFANAAHGSVQRGVALLMAIFCFLGIAIATISDLVLAGAKDGRLPQINPNIQLAIVVFIGVVIVVNVGAFAAAKLISPDKLRQWGRQDAEDKIFEQELAAISAMAPSVAASMAPVFARQWAADMYGQLLPETSVTEIPQVQIPAPQKKGGILDKLFGGKVDNNVEVRAVPVEREVSAKYTPRPFHDNGQSSSTRSEATKQRRSARHARNRAKTKN